MRIRLFRAVSLAGLAAFGALAQPSNFGGPVSGWVVERSSGTLRPVLGIPGAARIGAPLNLGLDLASGWVSPNLDSAAIVAADGSLHLFRLDSTSASELAVNGLLAGTESAAFSPTGSAAAFYGGGRVEWVAGLPGSPTVKGTIDLGGVVAAAKGPASNGAGKHPRPVLVRLAISDDGSLVLAAVAGTLRLLDSAGGDRMLPQSGAAMTAFAPRSHDAAVADGAGANLRMLGDVGGAATERALGHSGGAPAGLAFSMDGLRLYVASSEARSVTAFDVTTGASSNLPCNCAPSGIAPMGDLFRLNEPGIGPLWLLDDSAPGPRLVFVPPAAITGSN